jgi:hypothetical protein
MNYDLIYYFSLTRSQEPELKLHIPAPAKSFGSLRRWLHNTDGAGSVARYGTGSAKSGYGSEDPEYNNFYGSVQLLAEMARYL